MKASRFAPVPRRARGFTLLEAIVALTIFSICAIALYGWLAVNVRALARVEARSHALQDGRVALAVLERINPMAEPSGERALPGGLVVRWEGREIVDREPGVGPSGNQLVFDLALYELDVHVLRAGREENRFTLRRTGWEAARSLHDDDF